MQAKCTLNGEARMVHLMGQLNYAEVLDAVKDKFPGVGPFLVKYQDRCSPPPLQLDELRLQLLCNGGCRALN